MIERGDDLPDTHATVRLPFRPDQTVEQMVCEAVSRGAIRVEIDYLAQAITYCRPLRGIVSEIAREPMLCRQAD